MHAVLSVPRRRKNHDRSGHYRLAEELLADRGVLDDVLVGVAQAHATLALAAATAMAGDFGSRAEADAWRQAAGTTMAS
jgi:hypothetical protein